MCAGLRPSEGEDPAHRVERQVSDWKMSAVHVTVNVIGKT